MFVRSKMIQKRALVEVFSVRCLGVVQEFLKRIHEVILLKGSDRKYVLFEDRGDEKCPCVNSEGYFTLTGPECGVEVQDTLLIYPWLFDFIIQFDDSRGEILWRRLLGTDRFIKRAIESKIGIMRVDFAVYNDGIEAQLEVGLCGLELRGLPEIAKPIQINGTVKASNNVVTHSMAKSVLFDHITSQECVSFGTGPLDNIEITLPLSRSMTVIPRGSILIVDVSLYLHCAPQDICIINGSALFDTRPGPNSNREQKTLLGKHGTVRVKATWS